MSQKRGNTQGKEKKKKIHRFPVFGLVWRAFFRSSVKAEHVKLHWRDYRHHCAPDHEGISSVRPVDVQFEGCELAKKR